MKEGEVEYLNEVADQLDRSIKKSKEFKLIQIDAMDVVILMKHKNMPRSFMRLIQRNMLVVEILEVITENKFSRATIREISRMREELGALLSSGLTNYEDLIETIITSVRFFI